MSWQVVALGEVCTFVNGDRGKNYPSNTDFVDKGIPFINAGNLTDNQIDKQSLSYISRETFDLLSSGKVCKDDLLFCLRGSLGKLAIVNDITEGAIASSLVIIRGNSKITTRYLFQYLKSSLCKNEITKFANGVAQPNLSGKDLKSFKIPLPPLDEQKRIAAILDKADSLRRKRQQAIQLADEFLRAVFLDLFGDPVTNPKGWKLATIDSLTSNWKGGAPLKPEDFTNEGFPVLHKGAIQRNGIIKIDTGKKTHTSAAFAKKYKNSVINNTFMAVTLRDLVPAGPSIGLMADTSDYETQAFVLAQGAYGFQIDDKQMKPAYLVALTNNKNFRKNLSKIWVGSTQIHIRNSNYKGIEIPVPDFDLLCKYQQIADKTKSNVRRFELFENESQLAFKAFSQKAFAGEL